MSKDTRAPAALGAPAVTTPAVESRPAPVASEAPASRPAETGDVDARAALERAQAQARDAQQQAEDLRAQLLDLQMAHDARAEDLRTERADNDRIRRDVERLRAELMERRAEKPASVGPVRGRIARFGLALTVDGQPRSLRAGEPIPEGADLAGLPPNAVIDPERGER